MPEQVFAHPGDLVDQAAQVVAGLSLFDKAALCQGRSDWETRPVAGVPATFLADGPHGMRVQPSGAGDHLGLTDSLPATCFPTASAMAATWDVALIEQVARAIGAEARAQGADVVLGPGANLKRSPLCGRNFEYFSEDPHLTGALATAHVRGLQAAGVGTSLKHFVANNQETLRLTISAEVDERTLRELYLAGFEACVRDAQPWTLMSAYNRVNGTYPGEDQWLLHTVLREEWGHRGLVMTDWGAMNDRVGAIVAGCDLEMPGPVLGAPERLVAAVEAGDLDEALLDRSATRVVALGLAAQANRDPDASFDEDANHALARRAAAQAVVLLRNEADALPVRDDESVAVIGELAVSPRFQGTGSSSINPTRLDNLRDELGELLGADRVRWARGHNGLETDEDLLDEAVRVALAADVAIVHIGLPDLYENEGNDRTSLELPDSHNRLVAALAAVHDRVVVVLSNGSPVAMPWVHDVSAVVEGYLGGQAGGGGLADVLAGVVAPAGRLAETFPASLDDVPSQGTFPEGPRVVEYRETQWVGYRHTTTAGFEPLFPFGHGLTYGTVEVGEPRLDRATVSTEALAQGDQVEVTVTVRNDGDRELPHVVQVYVRDREAAVPRPRRELKGFTKVIVPAGEHVEAVVHLGRRAFAWWDVQSGDWVVEGGTFDIEIGNSSSDIVATAALEVTGPTLDPRPAPAALATPTRNLRATRAAFAEVLGRVPPANEPHTRPFNHNTPLGATRTTAVGKALHAATERSVRAHLGGGEAAGPLLDSMVNEGPLRALVMQGVSVDQVDALVAVLNGDFGAGAKRLMAELRLVLERRSS